MTIGPGGSFTDNFVFMSDDFGSWLAHGLDLSKFVSFSDSAAAVAVTTPKAPAEIAHGAVTVATATGQAVADAGQAVADAAMQGVSAAARDSTWLFIGGLGLLSAGLLLRSPSSRRRR